MTTIFCTDITSAGDHEYEILLRMASGLRRRRAERYRDRADALRCLTAEALLRRTLGTDGFTEEKDENGKPMIRERPDFHYNLSHSGNWVVLACATEPVGVDVERVRMDMNIEKVAGRFFSPEEQRYIQQDPDKSRERFFEIWTGKESYTKYLGTGLRTDLTAFSVLSPPAEVQLFHCRLDETHFLSLCTKANAYQLEILDLKKLLQDVSG